MDNSAALAPFIRGCTYDGEKGMFVIPVTGRKETAVLSGLPGVLRISSVNQSDTDLLEDAVVRELSAYRETHKSYPPAIIIEEIGVYALGGTYNKALAVVKGAVSEAEDSTSNAEGLDRNRVVRNKIALVTGGAQGFGEGLVRELAAAGAFVFIADLNKDGAEKLAAELNEKHTGETAAAVQVNVADEDSVREMFEAVVVKTGGIDLCISNAGVLKAGSVKEISLKDFRFVTDVNYIGYFLCTKFASPIMTRQSRGARKTGSAPYFSDIIQINSKSGLEGSNKNGAYAGGKFGGIGLTQSFAKELVTDFIKVNSICPGNFFDGPLWSDPDRGLFVQYLKAGKVPGAKTIADVKRFYESKVPMDRGCTVQDVVKAVYYIIDQKYETGQAVPVTGGQVMLT